MTEADLLHILNDLSEDDFENFKWFLKKEKKGDIEAIQCAQLEKAKKRDVVDLMVHKYELAGAVEVMKSVLKKITRNDPVKKLSNISSGSEGQSQEETNMTSHPESRSEEKQPLRFLHCHFSECMHYFHQAHIKLR